MFNFLARQIFVVHPRMCGGGILSLLLSLDSKTAALNFKHQNLRDKLADWQVFLSTPNQNAHLYGFVNFGHEQWLQNLRDADDCSTYIHKLHFYELDHTFDQVPLWSKMQGEKKSVGIYLTDACIEALIRLRSPKVEIDYYQKWVYSNQYKLLKDFYHIDSVHTLSFGEMLDIDTFVDHVKYCKDLFDLAISLDDCHRLIEQWYQKIGHEP